MEDDSSNQKALKVQIDNVAQFHKCIMKKTLNDVITIDQDLSDDIKFLEESMNKLVFDNYSKLLKTTDIIHGMGQEIQNIRQNLTSLESDFKDCLNDTVSLVTTLEPFKAQYRSAIAEKNLELIIKLPETLSSFAQKEKWEEFSEFDSIIKENTTIKEEVWGLKCSTENLMSSKIKKYLVKIDENKDFIISICRQLNLIHGNSDITQSILYDNLVYWLEKYSKSENLVKYCKNYLEILVNVFETLKCSLGLVEINKFHSAELLGMFEQSILGHWRQLRSFQHIDVELFDDFIIIEEKIYRIIQKINYLFDTSFDKHVLNFVPKVRSFVTSNFLKSTLDFSLASCHLFLGQFTHDVDQRPAFIQLAQDLVVNLKEQTFYSPESLIFNEPYLEEVWNKFVTLYFTNLSSEIRVLQHEEMFVNNFELLLYNSLVLDEISRSFKGRGLIEPFEGFEGSLDHFAGIYENEAKISLTRYIERCAESFFIYHIYNFMDDVKSHFNFSIIRSNIMMLNKIMSMFETYQQAAPSKPSISFKFTSDDISEFG
ncbi:hypothetical protein RF11_13808 [Thelohanellus kitauei]|uniref:Vacuolar protein sorting-associated protein 51 homolog n=1 Tax=Thelohanellus kitauei TaxID=669202 RepID=A0A0C2JIX8_THEKT|nr:hypothetical protein RF11_13808 [Thelohanellus kitauei]